MLPWMQHNSMRVNSAIHKAAGLMVPGRSMILPGTIPETPVSHEWSHGWNGPWGSFQQGERLAGDFLNSAVRVICADIQYKLF